jgi:hypothetical protein
MQIDFKFEKREKVLFVVHSKIMIDGQTFIWEAMPLSGEIISRYYLDGRTRVGSGARYNIQPNEIDPIENEDEVVKNNIIYNICEDKIKKQE